MEPAPRPPDHMYVHTPHTLAQVLTHAHMSRHTALQGEQLHQTVKAGTDTRDTFYLLWVRNGGTDDVMRIISQTCSALCALLWQKIILLILLTRLII